MIQPKRVTSGPKQHFFGYYDKAQWDFSDRWLLGCAADVAGRQPSPNDVLTLGMIDTQSSDGFMPFASTKAWCWQQGCMLQWLPGSDAEVIYNDRIGDRFVSIIRNVQTGEWRILPRPVYSVSPDGRYAVSLNFSRLDWARPGYGYAGITDWRADVDAPSDDGVFVMDLATGKHHLVISLYEMRALETDCSMLGVHHWVNHLLFNPSGTRFVYLHRWFSEDTGGFATQLCTANADGSDMFVSQLSRSSHFIWEDDTTILIWGADRGVPGYYRLQDKTDAKERIGENVLVRDGHCTVSPDKRWLLTDEYPDATNRRALLLYDLKEDYRVDIAHLQNDPSLTGPLRCDLHPRFNRQGDQVCIDSVHEGARQMYCFDVSAVVQ